MKARTVVKGFLTFIPGSRYILPKHPTSGTSSAAVCYSIWIKHLVMLGGCGMRHMPHTVAELGPGGSLGVGIAALLCGSNRYHALDVTRRARTELNLAILDELTGLFRRRAACPVSGWLQFDRYLDDDAFPGSILTDERLAESLAPDRLKAIRRAVEQPGVPADGITIEYFVPWSDESVVRPDSVDLTLSHSVLEHVSDVEGTWRALTRWCKPGGLMSHWIDFTSHGMAKEWNGHRACGELVWRIAMGRQQYLINREPYSVHRRLALDNDLELLCQERGYRTDGVSRERLARRWSQLSDDDLNCEGALVIARKPLAASEKPARGVRELRTA